MAYQNQRYVELQNMNQYPQYPPQQTPGMVMYQNPLYMPPQQQYPPQQFQQANMMPVQPMMPMGPQIMAPPMMGMPVMYPVQQQQIQPHMQNYSGFEKLMIPGIYVKQKVELLEALTGCETENKYKVYACNVDGEKHGISLFKAKEKSSCWARNCLPGDCRPFKIIVEHDSDGKFQNDKDTFLKMDRECACTFLCCGRPQIEVYNNEKGAKEYLGKVIHEFGVFHAYMSVYDKTQQLKYRLIGELCQCGMFSSQNCICCKSLQQAFFFLQDSNNKDVGLLEKRGKGFTNLVSDADNFSLIFPVNSTKEQRTLLLAMTLFMDFRYFENNTNNQNNNTHRLGF